MAGRSRYWLAVRSTFVRNEDELPAVLDLAEKTVMRAHHLKHPDDWTPFFDGILLIVWANSEEYAGEGDCGIGVRHLESRFGNLPRVTVKEVKLGDLYVGAANAAMWAAQEQFADWLIFMSPEAYPYLTPCVIQGFVDAEKRGARQCGVALPELGERARKGYTANTLGGWHLPSLASVYGFPSEAAKLPYQRSPVIQYWDGKKIAEVARCGVEEVVPQTRLVAKFGRCLAVISPDEGAAYHTAHMDAARQERHALKLLTKQIRQEAHLYAAGFSPSVLEAGVMPAIP